MPTKTAQIGIRTVMLVGALGASGCALDSDDPSDVETSVETRTETGVEKTTSAIQGGQLETGYPTVGMLQFTQPGLGNLICTATLISQSWVLTAGHCMGNNMRYSVGTSLANFVDYTVDQQIHHPQLDVALMHLSAPVEGVQPLRVNTGAAPAVGTVCTIVGFGDNGVPPNATNTVKRSATARVTFVTATEIDITWNTGITDGGDSGGPLLCNGVIAATDKGHDDGNFPQHQSSIFKPVDPTWIANTIAPIYSELTLQNGWTNAPFSTRNASVAIVASAVQFKGAIATSGTNGVAFTLPAAFRPEKDVYVPVDLCGGAKGSLQIKTNGVTTVRASGPWSDAQCFTSLEGVTFAPVFNGYLPLTLQNGWLGQPNNTNSPQISAIGGVVHLRGAIASGTNNLPFSALAAEFRPANVVYTQVTLCNSKAGRLTITPAGVVSIQAEDSFADAQCMTSLDGVTYVQDGTGFGAPLTPLGQWSGAPFSTATPGAKVFAGVVYLKGGLMTSGTDMAALTLPLGVRPPTFVYVPISLCNGKKGRLMIAPTGTVTVGAPGSIADAQCFTSLEGARFTVSDFTPLTLDNGWKDAAFATARAGFAISQGIVQLKGGLSTAGANGTVFTLPVAARPPTDVYLPVSTCDGLKGRLFIQTSGVATISSESTFSNAACFTSIEGVSYAPSTTGYTALTPATGWSNAPFGTRNAAAKDIGGVVHLAGALSGVANAASLVFTLPTALRPSATAYVTVDLCSGAKGRLVIGPDGKTSVEANTNFSSATCFTSLEGATFVRSPTGSTALPLLNGWSNAPFFTRNVAALNTNGIIRLQGSIAGGTSTPFVMPDGMRPISNTYVAADLCGAKKGRIFINTFGTVTVQNGEGTFADTAQCFTSLEGISFALGK